MGWPSSANSAAWVWRSPWAWTRFFDPSAAREPRHQCAHIGRRHRFSLQRADDRGPAADAALCPHIEPPFYDGEGARVEADGAPPAALAAEHGRGPGRAVQIFRQ
jgi:hypothetical protein